MFVLYSKQKLKITNGVDANALVPNDWLTQSSYLKKNWATGIYFAMLVCIQINTKNHQWSWRTTDDDGDVNIRKLALTNSKIPLLKQIPEVRLLTF